MAKALFTNNATGTLASAIVSTGATSLVLTSGQGALFPALSGGNYFWATIVDVSNNKEIVKVTANASDTFTIVRAQEGTTALTFASGSKVELRPTAAGLNGMLAASNDLSDLNSASTARTNMGCPSNTGSGASGTWGINITGSSASCTGNAATATVAGNITAYTINQSLGTGNSPTFAGLTVSGGLNSGAHAVTGAITATGDITAFASDDRLKTRVGNIESALDKLCSLDVFLYEFNQRGLDIGFKPGRHVGMSAQQWQAILPEVVAPAPVNGSIPGNQERDYLTLKYEKTTALIVEAIKELRAEVREIKKWLE